LTKGYIQWRKDDGVEFSSVRSWPIEWVNFRIHPCPHWPGVEMYRQMIRENQYIEPVVLCKDCLVVEDGWHRMAAYWLEGITKIPVVFANEHYPLWKGRCEVENTYHAEKLRPWIDLPFVSGAYREADFDNPRFAEIVKELTDLYTSAGIGMPKMRLWEQARAVCFLGNVHGKTILDVGTRESLVPELLHSWGAKITSIDAAGDFLSIVPQLSSVTYKLGDARKLEERANTYDFVLSTACLKHIPGTGDTKAVREMLRVVKHGGFVALSFDYGPTHERYPSSISGRRIYNEEAVKARLMVGQVVGPEDWSVAWDSDKEHWPIRHQAKTIWEMNYNLQVGFLLLEKP